MSPHDVTTTCPVPSPEARIVRHGWALSFVACLPLTTLGCSQGNEWSEGDMFELETGGSSDDGGEEGEMPDEPSWEPPAGDPCEDGGETCPCSSARDCAEGLSCQGGACWPLQGICGDGLLDPGEECDDGEDNADESLCKSDCTTQVCGDGAVGPGEACDDGNDDDGDGCSNLCAADGCGDGEVAGLEECDDANADDTDACLSTCMVASCGDSFVYADGGEECDDANANDSDGCTLECKCELTFGAPSQLVGWELTGDWGLYEEAPPNELDAAVPFGIRGAVLGSDGNRAAPYPGLESEVSSATTPSFELPTTLRFLSWHVDEGGVNSFDAKRVLVTIDDGATWTPLVDCADEELNNTLPMCQAEQGPREGDEWDEIAIDLTGYAGEVGKIRFEYGDDNNPCCGFEQGWYIDNINALDCG